MSAITALAMAGTLEAIPFLTPGLYEVEVRITLPNVQDAAAPIVLIRCVSAADVESGKAFFVLSDNPLRKCAQVDYKAAADVASYRIECPGPNRGSALAAFKITGMRYRGSISMNMGGKNMTMSETQVGRRIGDCP